MKFSIIIPYFNHFDYLIETITSIEEQINFDLGSLEIIIVDDQSTIPLTLECLENFNLNIKVFSQENSGPCVAKNNGVSNAMGEWLFFLDSDNKIVNDYFFTIENLIANHSNYDVFYSDFFLFGESTGIKKCVEPNLFKILAYNYIDNCAVVKKDTFLKAGGFDEKLTRLGLEDWELWVRLMLLETKFYYIQKPLFHYRMRNDSRTKLEADLNVQQIREYVFKKHAAQIQKTYLDLYNYSTMLYTSLPNKIGNILLTPYRLLKKMI